MQSKLPKKRKRFIIGEESTFFATVEGGYQHLPLEEKKKIIAKIHIPNMSVCEDVQGHYDYWKYCFNPNKEDCCNLRKEKQK